MQNDNSNNSNQDASSSVPKKRRVLKADINLYTASVDERIGELMAAQTAPK